MSELLIYRLCVSYESSKKKFDFIKWLDIQNLTKPNLKTLELVSHKFKYLVKHLLEVFITQNF